MICGLANGCLDSGSVEHVCDDLDAPGFSLEASPGSHRSQKFIVGNGNKVPNEGQKCLNLETCKDESNEVNAIQSTFQVAKVTRPLMSVAKITDEDLTCTFDKKKAVVKDSNGKTICTFKREGGLYVCRMKLKAPSTFAARGR